MAKKVLTSEEAYNRVASRCVQREYCRADWYRKLLEGGLTAGQVEEVLNRLERERFIDEARYARSYVHDKMLYDRWGRIKITYSLRQKGISSQDIDDALSLIDEQEYAQILVDLLKQKSRSIKAENDYELRQKLVRFAAGRGFEPGIIFRMLDMDDEILVEE